jgi:hypothetical protein
MFSGRPRFSDDAPRITTAGAIAERAPCLELLDAHFIVADGLRRHDAISVNRRSHRVSTFGILAASKHRQSNKITLTATIRK